ncbi:hypothetical protein [Roseibium sp. MB-4]
MIKEKSQIDKFKEAAKELECDESEEAFDAKLKSIAKSQPSKGEKKKGGM